VCFIVKNKGGERGGEDEKEKEKKKEGDSTLLQAMPSRRPRTENFSHKKIKKNSQNPSNTKKTHKNDFWFLVFFYWLVWFIFLGWVGFGFETPTANPDVTLPSLCCFHLR
jgi:ATP-dependent Zn protease